MHTYFISDLHLTPERPQISNAFVEFLTTQAPTAERVYILGDLFEFWIGDDAADLLGATPLLEAMKQVSQTVDCFFMPGNRDFLVRNTFTDLSGFKVMEDETIVDLYGKATLLLHGDSLCTDDHAHQAFRKDMMTNQPFCDNFLKLAIPQRIEAAKNARLKSDEHKSQISMGIMDVTEAAVIDAFERHKVTQMIHGHTHRQNTHEYDTDVGDASRYVLGDWHQSSSILKVDRDSITISNQAI